MIALKDLLPIAPSADFAHVWAYGCDACKFGIVFAPETNTTQPLYIQRAVQAGLGDITFCECQAGTAYRRHLRGVWKELSQSPSFRHLEARIREESQAAPTVHWYMDDTKEERRQALARGAL